ncbi:CapA family protein [Legionella israelensis]|uniref:CapA family protein n=1 Tax=Legionella israelensis TaxID=454 RepID=A0AAX1EJX5_9GAMM|nr:CapA family protein [Legionella israelensis]QBR85089.1 CapA family protein [Legionella israelensis]
MGQKASQYIRIFLCGDVMTGRGIDQILQYPAEPQLYESYVHDAREYVRLAEAINGKIPRLVHGDYLWGDAHQEWERHRPHLRLINLETSITASPTPWLNKGIHYRMSPENINALTSAKIDVCALANNHILDWGVEGLHETLQTLTKASIQFAGAGEQLDKAQAPAVINIAHGGRILIFSMGVESSGIPRQWQATSHRPGVWLLNDLSLNTFLHIKNRIMAFKGTQDLCIVSLHWGGNWGYQIPSLHQKFAYLLINEAGVDVVHGHSSHHPMGIEIYRGKLIFYGCGDFINDYEGISGYEEFKSDLALMYFLELEAETRELKGLEIVPMSLKKFRLHYACFKDCRWVMQMLQRKSPFPLEKLQLNDDGRIYLERS